MQRVLCVFVVDVCCLSLLRVSRGVRCLHSHSLTRSNTCTNTYSRYQRKLSTRTLASHAYQQTVFTSYAVSSSCPPSTERLTPPLQQLVDECTHQLSQTAFPSLRSFRHIMSRVLMLLSSMCCSTPPELYMLQCRLLFVLVVRGVVPRLHAANFNTTQHHQLNSHIQHKYQHQQQNNLDQAHDNEMESNELDVDASPSDFFLCMLETIEQLPRSPLASSTSLPADFPLLAHHIDSSALSSLNGVHRHIVAIVCCEQLLHSWLCCVRGGGDSPAHDQQSIQFAANQHSLSTECLHQIMLLYLTHSPAPLPALVHVLFDLFPALVGSEAGVHEFNVLLNHLAKQDRLPIMIAIINIAIQHATQRRNMKSDERMFDVTTCQIWLRYATSTQDVPMLLKMFHFFVAMYPNMQKQGDHYPLILGEIIQFYHHTLSLIDHLVVSPHSQLSSSTPLPSAAHLTVSLFNIWPHQFQSNITQNTIQIIANQRNTFHNTPFSLSNSINSSLLQIQEAFASYFLEPLIQFPSPQHSERSDLDSLHTLVCYVQVRLCEFYEFFKHIYSIHHIHMSPSLFKQVFQGLRTAATIMSKIEASKVDNGLKRALSPPNAHQSVNEILMMILQDGVGWVNSMLQDPSRVSDHTYLSGVSEILVDQLSSASADIADVHSIDRLLQIASDKQHDKHNIRSLNSALQATVHSRVITSEQRLEKIQHIMQLIKQHHIQPDSYTYVHLIHAYIDVYSTSKSVLSFSSSSRAVLEQLSLLYSDMLTRLASPTHFMLNTFLEKFIQFDEFHQVANVYTVIVSKYSQCFTDDSYFTYNHVIRYVSRHLQLHAPPPSQLTPQVSTTILTFIINVYQNLRSSYHHSLSKGESLPYISSYLYFVLLRIFWILTCSSSSHFPSSSPSSPVTPFDLFDYLEMFVADLQMFRIRVPFHNMQFFFYVTTAHASAQLTDSSPSHHAHQHNNIERAHNIIMQLLTLFAQQHKELNQHIVRSLFQFYFTHVVDVNLCNSFYQLICSHHLSSLVALSIEFRSLLVWSASHARHLKQFQHALLFAQSIYSHTSTHDSQHTAIKQSSIDKITEQLPLAHLQLNGNKLLLTLLDWKTLMQILVNRFSPSDLTSLFDELSVSAPWFDAAHVAITHRAINQHASRIQHIHQQHQIVQRIITHTCSTQCKFMCSPSCSLQLSTTTNTQSHPGTQLIQQLWEKIKSSSKHHSPH